MILLLKNLGLANNTPKSFAAKKKRTVILRLGNEKVVELKPIRDDEAFLELVLPLTEYHKSSSNTTVVRFLTLFLGESRTQYLSHNK